MKRSEMKRSFFTFAVLLACACSVRAAGDEIVLESRDAAVTGDARYMASTDDVGYWRNTNVVVSWIANVERAGAYRVMITIACDRGSAGASFDVRVGSQKANGVSSDTGGWEKYKEIDLGPVILRRPGKIPVEVQLTRHYGNGMNVRKIRLVREDG